MLLQWDMENTHESHETPWRRRNYSEIGHFFLVFIQLLAATSLNVHTVYILRMYMKLQKQSEIFSCLWFLNTCFPWVVRMWGFAISEVLRSVAPGITLHHAGWTASSPLCWGRNRNLTWFFFGTAGDDLEAHSQQVGFFGKLPDVLLVPLKMDGYTVSFTPCHFEKSAT